MELKKQQLTEKDTNRSFFCLVNAFNTPEKPQSFDIRSLRPGSSDPEIAEELAEYFNRISTEFDPLMADQVPTGFNRDLPVLRPH